MGVLRRIVRRVGWHLVVLTEPKVSSSELDLTGDREIEWAWMATNLPESPGRVLDFGPGTSATPLFAALRGGEVFTIDLLPPASRPYVMDNLTAVQGDLLTFDFDARRFDTVLNCSTVEHVGLGGRYGSPDIPDGDLQAMRRLRGLMAGPQARMVLTIPVGRDAVFPPVHRIYGPSRLPQLIDGFRIAREVYFVKSPVDRLWHEASRQEALAVQGTISFYALGLFVLSPL